MNKWESCVPDPTNQGKVTYESASFYLYSSWNQYMTYKIKKTNKQQTKTKK